ncbi:hypothetical protein DKX38_008744 [Salix brachista]|uniref:Uncharacterized protein n=1 Tax=Salix brachista TaxID=2182728 RepID=A0A5N5MRM8_9ROSI|nr:hypothetical protein DKX38_008744 [Salix brachista]
MQARDIGPINSNLKEKRKKECVQCVELKSKVQVEVISVAVVGGWVIYQTPLWGRSRIDSLSSNSSRNNRCVFLSISSRSGSDASIPSFS